MIFLQTVAKGFHYASQNISGEFASGHCEAVNVMAATLYQEQQ
jgi:hypothetical protein